MEHVFRYACRRMQETLIWANTYLFIQDRAIKLHWSELVCWTKRLETGHPVLLMRLGTAIQTCHGIKADEYGRAIISQVLQKPRNENRISSDRSWSTKASKKRRHRYSGRCGRLQRRNGDKCQSILRTPQRRSACIKQGLSFSLCFFERFGCTALSWTSENVAYGQCSCICDMADSFGQAVPASRYKGKDFHLWNGFEQFATRAFRNSSLD